MKIERGESTTSAILRAEPTNTLGLQPEVVSGRLLGRVGLTVCQIGASAGTPALRRATMTTVRPGASR